MQNIVHSAVSTLRHGRPIELISFGHLIGWNLFSLPGGNMRPIIPIKKPSEAQQPVAPRPIIPIRRNGIETTVGNTASARPIVPARSADSEFVLEDDPPPIVPPHTPVLGDVARDAFARVAEQIKDDTHRRRPAHEEIIRSDVGYVDGQWIRPRRRVHVEYTRLKPATSNAFSQEANTRHVSIHYPPDAEFGSQPFLRVDHNEWATYHICDGVEVAILEKGMLIEMTMERREYGWNRWIYRPCTKGLAILQNLDLVRLPDGEFGTKEDADRPVALQDKFGEYITVNDIKRTVCAWVYEEVLPSDAFTPEKKQTLRVVGSVVVVDRKLHVRVIPLDYCVSIKPRDSSK